MWNEATWLINLLKKKKKPIKAKLIIVKALFCALLSAYYKRPNLNLSLLNCFAESNLSTTENLRGFIKKQVL